MSTTLQEAIQALKPYIRTKTAKSVNIVKTLSGKFKSVLREGEAGAKIIRAMRETDYGRI